MHTYDYINSLCVLYFYDLPKKVNPLKHLKAIRKLYYSQSTKHTCVYIRMQITSNLTLMHALLLLLPLQLIRFRMRILNCNKVKIAVLIHIKEKIYVLYAISGVKRTTSEAPTAPHKHTCLSTYSITMIAIPYIYSCFYVYFHFLFN